MMKGEITLRLLWESNGSYTEIDADGYEPVVTSAWRLPNDGIGVELAEDVSFGTISPDWGVIDGVAFERRGSWRIMPLNHDMAGDEGRELRFHAGDLSLVFDEDINVSDTETESSWGVSFK